MNGSRSFAASGRVTSNGWTLPMVAPTVRRTAWRPAAFAQLMQSGHGYTASGSASSADSTALFIRGTQSRLITSLGNGTAARLTKAGEALPADLTGKAFRLTWLTPDTTRVAQVNLYVGDAGLTNGFKWQLYNSAGGYASARSNDWVVSTAGWADVASAFGAATLSGAGVPSTKSGFTDIAVEIIDTNTGNAASLRLQSIEIIDDTTTTFPNGVVSIVFDDSLVGAWTYGRAKMDLYGYRGTEYIIASQVGQSNCLTATQLHQLQDLSGWEIAGHAYLKANHDTAYTSLTAAVVDDDLRNMRAWLVSNGFNGDSFAYPGGGWQTTTDGVSVEQLTARYFSSGRTVLSNGGFPMETFPPPLPYRMRSLSQISSLSSSQKNPTNLVAAGGLLDRCALSGGWLQLLFHDIVPGAPSSATQISQSDFNSVIDAIASRGITVLPVADVLRTYS